MSQSCATTVKVSNPEKIGDGISAYVRYTLTVETTNPKFNGNTFEVHRRFREFHALYEMLVDIHRVKGIHIPHPPEKSITASTQVKISVKSVAESSQIEQRRLQLERFINRIATHAVLGVDEKVIDFLTQLVTTVKARDGLLKLKNNVESTISNLLPEMEDYDQWFEEKMDKINQLETVLQRTYSVGLDLHSLRKELIQSTKRFLPCINGLRAAERNETISKALACISELKEKSCDILEKQCLNDLHELVCTCRDYLDDLISIKHLMGTYQKKYSDLKSLETKLEKLKEKLLKTKDTITPSDCQALNKEIEEHENKLKFSKSSLEEFYAKLKEEVNLFDEQRVKDMRHSLLRYMKTYKQVQTELLALWENALPICSSIQ